MPRLYNYSMEDSDWKKLKHFKKDENWGDANKMDTALIFALDEFRDRVGVPMIVTSGNNLKHSPMSLHYQNLAVDLVLHKTPMCELPKIANIAYEMGFSVGMYCCWSYNGTKCPGLHLDKRTGKQKRWIGIGSGPYLPYNEVNVKRYFSP